MDTAAQYLNLTSALITVGSVVFIIQLFFKWQNSPRFTVGILPDAKEQKDEAIETLGTASHFDEFVFNQRYFAKKLKHETDLTSLRFDNDSARSLYRNRQGNLELPIIIQNEGRSEAPSYKLTVSFTDPEVRIVQVLCESLSVGCLYTQDETFLQDQNLRDKMPTEELRQIYQSLNLTSDFLCLEGSLESRTFEAIFMKVHVPEDCRNFSILFKIDCPDFVNYERQVHGQYVNIFQPR